jgi:lyso-ornithine lipid O-acyltransferase
MYIKFRAIYRLLFFSFLILLYFLNGIRIFIFNRHPIQRRKKYTENSHFYAEFILKAFNVEVICKHNIPADEGCLLIGNHVGFIDIVCLHALRSSVFITSVEMKQTPVLGQITDLAGCVYVNRKNRMNIQDELNGVTEVLKQGFRVVLYAESVASNGEQVLPFKKTLLMAAGFSGQPIRPFVFNFRAVNNKPVLYSQRDNLCWYGSQTFLPAIWRSMLLDSITCEVEFLPQLHPEPDTDRGPLAKQLHEMISERFVPFTPEMNLQTQASSNILSHSL